MNQPAINTVDSALHNYERSPAKWLWLAFLATTPVGHVLVVLAIFSKLFSSSEAPQEPQREDERRAERDARVKAQPRQRPRAQEPHMSREDYEAKIREAMGEKPAYDFEGTCVEEPVLALGQYA